MNESNHNINFIYGFFHKFQLAFWTHINWYPEQTLFLNNLTVTWIVHDPQHCESKNKRYQCTFLYSVWCLSHKEFSRYHHNQADDIVCTLTSAPITAKSISAFCLQREVENMRHALYQMAISFSGTVRK